MTAQLRPELYPDFRDKRDKQSYQSVKVCAFQFLYFSHFVKVIGVLYRQITKPINLNLKSTLWSDVSVDPDLVYPNYEEYIEEALEAKRQYNFNLRCIMNQFGVRNEAEALSGHILLPIMLEKIII